MSEKEEIDYLKFFTDWIEKLQESLKTRLPELLDDDSTFITSCKAVQSANTALLAAAAVLDEIQKQKEPVQAEVDKAKQAAADAQQALQDSLDVCQAVAVTTILDKDFTIAQPDFDDADLVTYTVLQHGTAQGLADWCDTNKDKAQQLIATIQEDTELMKTFLESGGARNGKYGEAVDLYKKLVPQASSPVLERLALACALELADPYPFFNKSGVTDAVARYIHYEQAYQLGELDPAFGSFNVWEYREVVDSWATDDESSWGRESLWAYRPDLALWEDRRNRYCQIVHTDVAYKEPDWYKQPPSYDQILSGGGECGPRAWYGRFICKAFGIPTWGVKQPGHAAMALWTPNGWVTNLGAGFQVSWWDDQGGLDFELETKARRACRSEREFEQKVLRLQWISTLWDEDSNSIRMQGIPDPKALWYSLGMMQRRRLAETSASAACAVEEDCVDVRIRQLQRLRLEACKTPEAISEDRGAIVIPAATCTNPTSDTKQVMFLPSALGGRQLFLHEDAEIEFLLPNRVQDRKFRLSCRVAVAHRTEAPIVLKIGDEAHTVKLPYTTGVWQQTQPIQVKFTSLTMTLSRPEQPFGFSIKDIRMVPIN